MKDLFDVVFKVLIGAIIVIAFVNLIIVPTVTGLLKVLG